MSAFGKTPAFRRMARAVQRARFLVRRPDSGTALVEALEARRLGFDGDLSRRRFVRALAGAGIALSLPLAAARRAVAAPQRVAAAAAGGTPVAVVGAGFAGLATAYHLTEAGVPCTVYDAQSRVGGRVMTRHGFNDQAMFCELGAELVDTNHEDLQTMCEALGLELESIAEEEEGIEGALYHQGGHWYTDRDLIEGFGPLAARIQADQERVWPGGDGEDAEALARLDGTSLAEYLAAGSETDAWIRRMLLGAYRNEYGLEPEQQSALNLVGFIDADTSDGVFRIFGDSDESLRIRGGNGALAEALDGHLAERGVRVEKGHALVALSQSASGEIRLTFEAQGATRELRFGQAVLAIPFTTLRQVEGLEALDLSEPKRRCIRELGYGSNAKLMLGFRERYWRRADTGVAASNANIYTDLDSQEFWDTSRAQPGSAGLLTNFMGGDFGRDWSPERLPAALRDLASLYPGKGAVPPLDTLHDGNRAWMHWPSFRWTQGSYSCPLVGQYAWTIGAAASAELDGRLLFAGEHTSEAFAGFMNGALESGRRAATEVVESRLAGASIA